jgi:ATP-dependent Clp protease ATP-binding subunit ClpA
MTSNIGTAYISDASIPYEQRVKGVQQELKQHFKPEFLNRVDDIIIFNPLTREHINKIILIQLNEVGKRLKERGISLELTTKALDYLVEVGFDPQFGARPLKRALQRHILNPLSVKILAGEVMDDDTVVADYKNGEIQFAVKRNKPEKKVV